MTDDYKQGDNKFTGKIHKVVIEVGPVKLGAADKEELRKSGHCAEGGGIGEGEYDTRPCGRWGGPFRFFYAGSRRGS